MKRSRLKLFKTTSLTISVIGVILILLTVGVGGYLIVSGVTNTVSTTVSSGSAYDQLDQLKSDYGNISIKYDDLNKKLGTNPDPVVKTNFNNGRLKLSEINQTLSSIQSDISNGKPESDINSKMDKVKNELKEVKDLYGQLTGTKQ